MFTRLQIGWPGACGLGLSLFAMLWSPFASLCRTFRRAGNLSMLKVSRAGDAREQPEDDFLSLVDEARRSIELFDDGNKLHDSICESERVIRNIREKLDRSEHFTITCHFNKDEELRFTSAFETHDRVSIFAGIDPQRSQDQVHYKIIDDGRIAYLSARGHAESERSFRRLDSTELQGKALKDTTQFLFRELRENARAACERHTAAA